MQSRLKYVSDQEGVISLALGAQPVFEDFGRVLEFEIAILIGDRAMRAEPEDVDLRARRSPVRDQSLQKLSIAAAFRPARHSQGLIEKTHAVPPVPPSSHLAAD